MKSHIIYSSAVLLWLALGVSAFVYAGSGEATDAPTPQAARELAADIELYQLHGVIKHAGKVLSQPNVLLAVGKTVNLSWSGSHNGLADFRLDLTLARMDNPSHRLLTAQLFEKKQTNWITMSAPAAVLDIRDPMPFTTAFQAAAKSSSLALELSLWPVSIDKNGKVSKCNKRIEHGLNSMLLPTGTINGSLCASDSSSLMTLLEPNDANKMREDCCSVSCSTGTLTCCGAVSCCDGICGACCSPP